MRIVFLLLSGAFFLSAQAAAPSGITYTCDPSINALPGVCNTLNTTIAGLYASTFTNANANIYIQFGTTGLGKSLAFGYGLTYTTYRNALQNTLAGANDLLAFSASVPVTNPIDSTYTVEMTIPLLRVLGFTPTVGANPDGTSCQLTASDCYDGIITISSAMQAAGNLYYRSGSIALNQYDFFSVVEHETDEILGTRSCVSQCSSNGSTRIAPADLYRYQSNGARGYAPGNNASCASPNVGNACFSIDGVHMLQQYNNVSGQGDFGDWVPTCPNMRVQNAAACPGVAGVDISPTAEIEALDVVGYTLVGGGLTVVDRLTSTTATPGSCTIPPPVSNFTTTAPNVWLYFSVTGAHAGDTFQVKFVRPDTSIDTTLNSTVSTVGINGSQCFALSMPVSGASAASFPGTWAIRVLWNQSASPLFTLNFTLSQGACIYSLDNSGEAFDATGGDGAVNVTAAPGCSWNASGPSWVTFTGPTPGTGSGSGAASFHVAADPGSARAASLAIAGLNFAIEQEAASIPGLRIVGSMAQLAGEENWTTAFTLVNKSAGSAIARLSLFGDPLDPTGNGPLTLPLLFPQAGAAAPLLAATFDRTLAANASLIVNTAGPQTPPVLVGSAQLAATGKVDGFAIFHQIPSGQEAVVPMETRTAGSYLLAFDNTNGLVLGVAVENLSAAGAVIPVVIRDENGVVISAPGDTISLGSNGHAAFVLSTQFPVTANILGTIEFDTPAGGRISVLGLRFTPPNSALTTIPALANIGPGGGSIAHLASGGDGWQTTFVLVNTGVSATQFTLSFFADQTGAPLSLPLSFPQPIGGAPAVAPSLTQSLAAGATRVVVSSGAANLLTGSAQLTTGGQIGGFVIFRHNNQEAVVPLESRNAAGYILAFDDTNGTATGIAVNAVSAGQAIIPVTVRDSAGTTIATDAITLSANGHYAFTLVTDRYPAAANIRGTIEFDTPAGAQIGALGIRIPNSAAHTYTTLPALAK
jgi:hypothetical protein